MAWRGRGVSSGRGISETDACERSLLTAEKEIKSPTQAAVVRMWSIAPSPLLASLRGRPIQKPVGPQKNGVRLD